MSVPKIDGLERLSPARVPEFRVAGMRPDSAAHNPNPDYVLTADDVVELRVYETASAHAVTVKTYRCATAGCKACAGGEGIPESDVLVEGKAPRLPVSVLSALNGITIAGNGKEQNVSFCEGTQSILLPPRRMTWGDFAKRLSNKSIVARLISNPPRRVLPGDVVETTILWRLGRKSEDTARPFEVVQARTRVDERGQAFIPALNSPTKLARDGAAAREAVAALDAAALRVTLWTPGATFADQITLAQASACLSTAWSGADIADIKRIASPALRSAREAEVDQCLRADIEGEAFRPQNDQDNNVTRVRYSLDAEQEWIFVSPRGVRFTRRFVPGATIAAAVTRAERETSGVELLSADWPLQRAYVIVVPRAELGPGRSSKPFWDVMVAGRQSALENVLIAPGDLVYVSRWFREATSDGANECLMQCASN